MQNISTLIDFFVPYAWCTKCASPEKVLDNMLPDNNTDGDSQTSSYMELCAINEDLQISLLPKVCVFIFNLLATQLQFCVICRKKQ